MKPSIATYMSKEVNLSAIKIDDINIYDIAHALSQICRFTGHTKKFYSVAEHSVRVSYLALGQANKRYGLMHDAAEAYINDLSTSLKKFLSSPDLNILEARFQDRIHRSTMCC